MTPLQTIALTATMLAASSLSMTRAVFVPLAMPCMGEGLRWNYLWAGLCLVGAVLFVFLG